jgi:hypothetical protein
MRFAQLLTGYFHALRATFNGADAAPTLKLLAAQAINPANP